MSFDSVPPPSRVQVYSCEYGDTKLRVRVVDGAVDCSEAPDVRTIPWSLAYEWLIAQGYTVARVDSGTDVVALEFEKRKEPCL